MNSRLVIAIAAVLLVAATGWFAYNAGVAHGIEQNGKTIVYGWHGPGPFFFGPLFFLFFFLLLFRGGRRWHHHDHCAQRREKSTE